MNYNPAKKLPYPIHVSPDDRCTNVPGYPLGYKDHDPETLPILVGFQPGAYAQTIEIEVGDFRRDPQSVVGKIPVFLEPGGISDGMFNLSVIIASVDA